MEYIHAVGRRKTSVSRVFLKKGEGNIKVNDSDYKEYFKTIFLQSSIEEPFKLSGTAGQYDVMVNVYGGGTTGQAEATRLAISRALIQINEEFKDVLKSHGLLKRDPRMVERKKPGFPKARKRFQFRKR
ncbi:MAG TPA: 30S ribosomal protein S9 [Bacteroidia bacterium]|nr:30S ribosomal protein S9 [Sphingobacteriales bacterium]HPD64753.1 30S ribosomal protein S9 [Bacteroidia bacterium]HRS59333.1 30S ribosomal protein S9 [Bacteroidia bacterium]HRU69143.1 30S ribosomal protein S9 [Bacteroidia bacterium]